MNFEHRCIIPAARAMLWEFLMDVPRMARCVPGVDHVEPRGPDEFAGRMHVRIGPISLTLDGVMTIRERDEVAGMAAVHAEANDRRVGGGMHADARMTLLEQGPSATELLIVADARLLGKLGEFGQPLIRRKAEATIAEFARNVAAALAA